MYDDDVRDRARQLREEGLPIAAIARELGVSRFAVREWLTRLAARRVPDKRCFRCRAVPCPHPEAYAYLLGQYLGDGHLTTSTRVPRLRIICADAYPAIAGEVDDALSTVSRNRVGRSHAVGCSQHRCCWMHWPCLLPQHGAGRKHERPIVLADWQEAIVDEHPWPLIRGLIHSDGCRAINTVRVGGRTYSYPRYLFSNESRDIQSIFTAALDRVGVPWRNNRPNSVSIARRVGVDLVDRHVGAKR